MTVAKPQLSASEQALLLQRLQKARTKKTEAPTIGRMPSGEPIPLSFTQQRLWFLYQWDPTNPTYNIPLSWHIEGNLNVPALRAAVNELIQRHEILQMRHVVKEEVFLDCHPNPLLPLEMVDLGELPAEQRENEAIRLAFEEARKPFDLESDLPIRVELIRLNDTEHVLLLTLHHIAADGWSIGVLHKELVQLYSAFEANLPSPLPALPIQYADFAYWQRNNLQGEILARQSEYWKKQLAGIPKVLELPTDFPRPATRTYNGAVHAFQLDDAVSQALYEFTHQHGYTPFMVALAAFQLLLRRYSGQDDIVVGTPIAGRTRSETEGLIGCFINTLALRTRFSGHMAVQALLQQVRDTTLNAFAHQDLPFEKLVEELQPQRDLQHSPIFQVMIVFENMADATGLQLPGLAIKPLVTNSQTAKFDLTLSLRDYGKGFVASLTYNTDLFRPDSIQRMAGHFEVLLREMIAHAQQPIGSLSMLTGEERRQILEEWNQTPLDVPAVQAIQELFEAQVERTPEAVAVACNGQQLTYRELNARANQLAHSLRGQGVGPETRVGLFMDRSLDLIVGLWGILKAGGAYVPIDPMYPGDRLKFILQSAHTPILLTHSNLAMALPSLGEIQVFCLDTCQDTLASCPQENPAVVGSADNLMYVLFTSGSTGHPKGVAVQHASYLNYLAGFLERIEAREGLRYAIVSTFAADLGTPMVYGALCTGGQVHVIPYEQAVDPEAMVAYFRRNPIDVIKMVPSHFEAWLASSDPAAVIPQKRLILAGEASHWETMAKIRQLRPEVVLHNHYGPTETTVSVLAYPVPAQPPESKPATVPIGRPLGNIRTYVLDKDFQPVPQGVPGELYLGGAGVTRGYLERPDLTAERFLPDPFNPQGGGRLYRTGDLVRSLPDGAIEFLGRVDFQVKIRGYRIELGEIEALLGEHAEVQDVAVVAREDTRGEKRLVAYVVARAGKEEGLSSRLREFLRQNVPDYMVPSAFVRLEALPLTPNGKLDRQALPAPEQTHHEEEKTFVAPRNELEERIAAVWSSILGLEKIGIDDNFFDLGGESFKAIKVVRKIGETLSVMDLFKNPTIRQLAIYLAGEQPHTGGILNEFTKAVRPENKVANVVCIPYGGGSSFMYKALADLFPANYSVYGVEIPGHDYSHRDEPLAPLEETARRCAEEICQTLNGPLVLYGHCVGGALTLEIARLLEAANVKLLGVIMGGNFPNPRLPGKFLGFMDRLFSNERWTSERQQRDFLVAMGGLMDMVSPEEQIFVVRGMRHDAAQAEDYYTRLYAEGSLKLKAPILSVVGDRDRTTRFSEELVKEWENFSASVSRVVIPQAGHYFLKYQANQLVRIIDEHVGAWKNPLSSPAPQAGSAKAEAIRPAAARAASPAPSLALFLWVAFGQFVSIIGTGLSGFALGIWIYQQTNSVSLLGIITAFSLVPSLIALPLAGAVADRIDRRVVMMVSDSIAGLGTLALALLLWTGTLQIWHIYTLTALSAIANAFQRPAYVAAVTQLVPKRFLGQASGIVQLGGAVSGLISPLLGGVLLTAIGLHGIVLVDFATFLFAAGILLFVRFPNTLFRRQEEPLLKEISGGWRFIARRYNFVVMVVFFIVFNYLDNVAQILLTPLALSFGTPALLGMGFSAAGVGVLAGSVLMSVWGGTKRRATGMIASALLTGLAILMAGWRPAPALFVGGLFCYGFAAMLLNAHWQTMIQTKVGLELQGRVLATNQMLAMIMAPLGALTAGPLTERLFGPLMADPSSPWNALFTWLVGAGAGRGIAVAAVLLGTLMALWSILGLRYRPLRYMEDVLPDAVPDGAISGNKDLLQEQLDRRLGEHA